MTGAWIAIDWGTSSFRAHLLDEHGVRVDSLSAPLGILRVEGDFGATYDRLLAPWYATHGELPAIAAGMIGSRQGWRETEYVACPAGPRELAARIVEVRSPAGHRLSIVPGVMWQEPVTGIPDVMRGEETQVLGELAGGAGDGLFILPGTHSKWVRVERGRIVALATWMTGELFAVLASQSILGRLMPASPSPATIEPSSGFDRGVSESGRWQSLFGARTLPLLGRLDPEAIRPYLSGLLIGAEIAEGLASFGHDASRATLIGEPALVALYQRALCARGLHADRGRDDAVVLGLGAILEGSG